jgi:hypothetical protein
MAQLLGRYMPGMWSKNSYSCYLDLAFEFGLPAFA